MKTSELSGAALDWAVGIIEGTAFDTEEISLFIEDWEQGEFNYSSDWALAGAIIEREGIAVDCERSSGRVSGWVACNEVAGDDNWDANVHYGTTPLIAAMRCYVTSKLGDEVELPEELNGQV